MPGERGLPAHSVRRFPNSMERRRRERVLCDGAARMSSIPAGRRPRSDKTTGPETQGECSRREVAMTNVKGQRTRTGAKADFDAVIIGAGFSGMYMLHSLRDKLDLKVTVFEAGDGIGGTWYWNRYPGARCDSDSYIYCYTFDKNLLQEWEWSERYPQQDEILRYLEHCAERFDLKPDIQFGKRVVEVVFDDDSGLWTVRTDKGDTVRARFVITAVGALSTANVPPFKGLGSFKGKCYHTSQWPHDGVDFTAKRVGVIGTGRHRRAGDPRDRATGQAPDGVPAHAELLRAGAQRPGRPRGRQGPQGRL